MRDPQVTISLLEAKAKDAAVTAPEREAIYTKIEELRERHPEPVTQTGGAKLPPTPPRPPAPPGYASSFNFGAGEGGWHIFANTATTAGTSATGNTFVFNFTNLST